VTLDQDTIDALKVKHGDLLSRIDFDDDVVVIRPPTDVEFKRFKDRTGDKRGGLEAVEEVGYCCAVHPDPEAFKALAKRKPGVPLKAGECALELAGVSKDIRAEKL
jgi:hypothetical protein